MPGFRIGKAASEYYFGGRAVKKVKNSCAKTTGHLLKPLFFNAQERLSSQPYFLTLMFDLHGYKQAYYQSYDRNAEQNQCIS